MVIKLASGDSISLNSFYSERTYAGLMEGLPTPELNTKILARARSRMSALWGQHATHIIRPATRQEQEHPIFPELTCFAWLKSHTPINPDAMASELVVVWFAPELPDVPLSTIVSEAIRDIPWARLAREINW